jgi:hypothetical protein
MKPRKKVQYANPILHVIRKRTTVLAVQLTGEESIDVLSSFYLGVIKPDSFNSDGELELLHFDLAMGVLSFHPVEKPLEMTIGDWLVYDGDSLSVVSNSMFLAEYRITVRNNKKEKSVRSKKDRIKAVRQGSDEYNLRQL